MKTYFLISFCLVFSLVVSAQNFQRVPNVDLKGGYLGFASWCDYNSDGLLDIFVTGEDFGGDFQHAELYKNNGDKTFSESNITNIPRVIYGDQAWGDYDNNGTPDLLYAGTRSGFSEANITKLYKNIGGIDLVEVPNILPSLDKCTLDWVDVNNDGLIDIYLQGINSSNQFEMGIYKNMGQDSFVKIEVDLNAISGSYVNCGSNSAKWADFDNDGLKDVVMGKSTNQTFSLEFYKNLGNFKFQLIDIGLPNLNYVKLATSDFNQDGLMDFVFIGSTQPSLISSDVTADIHVFINQGGMKFTEGFTINNVGAFINTLDVGDIDNDGFPDIMLYGAGGYTRSLKLYKNKRDGSFGYMSHFITDSDSGGASFGDFDNDNDLDILYYGRMYYPNEFETTCVYENNSVTTNSQPSAPDSIKAWAQDNDLNISWNKGKDDATLPTGLYYNMNIGTSSNPNLLLSGCSLDGKLKTPNTGNMDQNQSFWYLNFPEGNFQITLQSIDNSYNASGFSEANNICFKKTTHIFGDSILICEGENVVLSAPAEYPGYLWNTGSTAQTIVASETGLYNVNLLHPDGCISSETVFLKVQAKPEFYLGSDTTITTKDSLVLSAYQPNATYLWSDNSQDYHLLVRGEDEGLGKHTFWLKVTNQYGCFNLDTIVVTVIKETGNDPAENMKVYPIPIQDDFTIENEEVITGTTKITIVNTSGNLIYQDFTERMEKVEIIKLPDLNNGVYFLTIENKASDIHQVFKLVK
jgi:hypothetical protein